MTWEFILTVVEMTNKGHCISSWKIEPSSFRFLLKGSQTYDRILPFSRALTEPQKGLVTYIMRQMSSRELVISQISYHFNKQKDVHYYYETNYF